MSIKVKICGIKTLEAATVAVEHGADFLGFNFVLTSKRLISPISAQKIIRSLPKESRPICVGVFMNQSFDDVKRILSKVQLNMLQFHGQESPKFCASFKLPYIKTFTLGKNTPLIQISKQMKQFKPDFFLLDRENQGKGLVIDLVKVRKLAKKFPIFLAGGLNPKNLKKVLPLVKGILGVDVAGGVETRGKKDFTKIRIFLYTAKLSSRRLTT